MQCKGESNGADASWWTRSALELDVGAASRASRWRHEKHLTARWRVASNPVELKGQPKQTPCDRRRVGAGGEFLQRNVHNRMPQQPGQSERERGRWAVDVACEAQSRTRLRWTLQPSALPLHILKHGYR